MICTMFPAVLIEQVLSQPTLIHLPGVADEPIFISILLHGDEDVGFKGYSASVEWLSRASVAAGSICVYW